VKQEGQCVNEEAIHVDMKDLEMRGIVRGIRTKEKRVSQRRKRRKTRKKRRCWRR
jgi:hypothetical protein